MKKRAIQLSAWTTLAAIVFVTVSPIDLRPADLLPVDVDRALAFAFLAALFTMAYPRHWRVVGIVLILAAFAIELLQELSPTRHARIDDAVVKAVGAFAGVMVGGMVSLLQRRLVASKSRWKRSLLVAANDSVKRIQVESRSIQCVYFDPADGKLRVRFKDGRERLFADVPEQEALAIATAESPGRYYADRIKPNFRRIAA